MGMPALNLQIEIAPQLLTTARASDALRAAVQIPMHLRFFAARMAMFVAADMAGRDDEIRALSATGLGMVQEAYGVLADLLEGRADLPSGEVHAVVVEVCTEVGPRHPEALAAIRAYEALVRGFAQEIAAGCALAPDSYDRVMRTLVAPFHPAVLTLSDAMAEAGASFRARRDVAAVRARDRAMAARERIDDIARTVRLISLNARVEAARAGGAGRAFGVIAEEIRALSEQTEEASEELAGSVRAMMTNLRSV